MEVIEVENVVVENAVLISGLTNTEIDEDLTDFLNKYGSIRRHLTIDDPKSPYHKEVIVEYSSCSALVALKPLLPYTFKSPHKVAYHIKLLSSIYTSAVTESATTYYFAELKRIAKLSGRTFNDLLKEQLLANVTDVAENPANVNDLESSQMTDYSSSDIPLPTKRTEHSDGNRNPDTVRRVSTGSFSPTLETKDVNPPEVQRMIIEHIVKSDGASTSSVSFRLRVFSGKVPRPNGEVDYDAWRNSVELILQDPSLSDLHRSRKILDSLLPPASEIVKQLGAKALPAAYLEVLDSAFGTVEDGDDLFAKFLNTLQNAGEKPSLYLQRLYTSLLKVMKRGGIPADEADRQLLKQFCRGCWDDMLIANLQLEHKRNKPPPFPELLLQLRSEENKHFTKESRMKQHLGVQKQRASSHVVTVNPFDLNHNEVSEHTEVAELKKQITTLQSQLAKQKSKPTRQSELPSNNAVLELKQQVTELQSQMAKLKAQKNPESTSNSSKLKQTSTQVRKDPPTADHKQPHRPKPGYCFRCGEDGHVASICENDPNPPLVADKRKKLKERQVLWDSQYGSNASGTLNTIQPW